MKIKFHRHLGKHGADTRFGLTWRASKTPDVGWLYDFKVDSAELRPAHKIYLDQVAITMAGQPKKKWYVAIQGRTSRTGSDTHNLGLSIDRANAAYAYLQTRVPKSSFIPYGVGETAAAQAGEADNTEDMYFRAVVVSVWGVDDPPPPDPKPPPSETKKFMVRVRWGGKMTLDFDIEDPFFESFGAGVGLGPDMMRIQVLDCETGLVADFNYQGMEGEASAHLGMPEKVKEKLKNLKRFGPVRRAVEKLIRKVPLLKNIKKWPTVGWHRQGRWQEFEVPRYWSLEDIGGNATVTEAEASSGTLGKVTGEEEDEDEGSKLTFSFWKQGRAPYTQEVEHFDTASHTLLPTPPSVGRSRTEGPLWPSGKPYKYDGN